MLGVFFITIIAVFYITPNAAFADLPCGTIISEYRPLEVIDDCDDPFGVRPAEGFDITLYIDSVEVEEGEVVATAIGGTSDLYVAYTTQLDDVNHAVYKHEGDDYVELDISELVEPTHDELLVYAAAFFESGTDLNYYVDAYPDENDDFTEEEDDLFYDFMDYVYDQLVPPPLRAGVYTWVVRDYCLTFSQNTFLEKLKHMIIPVAYASGCFGPALEGYIYTRTFELIEEDVVEPEPEIDPLLLQYAPILYMHEKENYFPMNVESFVNDSALWEQSGSDTQLQTADELTFEAFETLLQAGIDTESTYLAYSDPDNAKSIDLGAAKTKYNQATTSGEATTTVYVHKMTDDYTDEQGTQHNFIVLQYWYFYAMNNWGEHQTLGNNHEGDWESVFVFLDADTEEPKYVAYSAHHNDGVDDTLLQYGSVRRSWESDEVSKSNSRVDSFVSVGSHAMYPNAGTKNTGLGNDISSILGFKIRESVMKDVSVSGDVLETWVNYEGKWGTDTFSLGGDGPLSPAASTVSGHLRFHEPVAWAGIDQSTAFTIIEPTTHITSTVAQVIMQFTDALQDGTVVTIDPHNEYVSFGTTVTDTAFLPRYYDFDTSMLNGTFEVEVTLTYTDEELLAFELDENDLTIFYYNIVTDSWEEVDTAVDPFENTVSFITDHFSRYAIGVPEEAEYSLEELFDLFRQEVDETDVRSYQKRFLKRYSKLIEKFIVRDTDKAIHVARKLINRLQWKVEKYEKWNILTSEESMKLGDILGEIEDKL